MTNWNGFADEVKQQPRRGPKCKTCAFLDILDDQSRTEVEEVLGNAKYAAEAVARVLAVRSGGDPRVPGIYSILAHRRDGH